MKAAVMILLASSFQLSLVTARAQFVSHVHVATPAHSYSHGVGDLVDVPERPTRGHSPLTRDFQKAQLTHSRSNGYPRYRPSVPFPAEDIPSMQLLPWKQSNHITETITLLPPSPYKVDSPDPESLWPSGLFFPPLKPPRFDTQQSKTRFYGTGKNDPYLLEGANAIAAVEKARRHGLLYFHDIPHLESLLANQEHRIQNSLPPNRIGSIRHSWPFNRP
ncbi:uncharacterized protein LOC126970672 [Leptidea sinapis]|uniref:uncharacterized protein LOC126970672 n=1 Tax=Leptidea sinapis TaxID=189913 RepID=UPI0021C48948|nr:uncharacterized protein LOC126970672 [Leptidea sinapis]